MNTLDIILLIIIAAALTAAIASSVKRAKQGRLCGGDCAGCKGCSMGCDKK